MRIGQLTSLPGQFEGNDEIWAGVCLPEISWTVGTADVAAEVGDEGEPRIAVDLRLGDLTWPDVWPKSARRVGEVDELCREDGYVPEEER